MADPEQNRITACKKFLRIEKEPVWRAVYPSWFVFLSVRAVASGEQPERTTSTLPGNQGLYRSNRRTTANLGKSCWPTFAGKVIFGCVDATSATDLPMLALTGVARKAWMSPACGPVSTVAMPEICPLSLILLAKRGSSAVFPRCSTKNRLAAVSGVAYSLAFIVDPECVPVWVAIHGRKRLGIAFFP
jgi:hypothetical protein